MHCNGQRGAETSDRTLIGDDPHRPKETCICH